MIGMIRNLQPLDLLKLPLWRGGCMCEQSITLERIGRADAPSPLPSIAREQIAPRRRPFVWVAESEGHVVGVAAAHPRSGLRAWEVSHLWAVPEPGGHLLDLLDQMAATAAGHGAHRVFLRLEGGSRLATAAIRAGFRAAWEETLYARNSGATGIGAEPPTGAVRPRCAADELSLFRLYCSTSPASVRSAVGLTVEEWRDAQEVGAQRVRQWVYEGEDGEVKGWAEQWTQSAACCAAIAGRPEALAPLLSQLLAPRPGLRLQVLAADYLETHCRVLESNGFAAAGRYLMLVKSVTAPIREAAFVPACV